MKILVTGGAGFIGSNFIRYWLKKHPKDKIINLDKLTYAGHLSSTKDFKDNKNYEFVKGSITNKKLVNKLSKKVETIVHFAAESHVDRSIKNPDVFLKTNILGTNILLSAVLNNKINHFHHVSTDEVFGSLKLNSDKKFNDSTNYDPRSPYSASKAASDHLVMSYFHTYGLPVTITNCSNNFGPYQDPEKFLPRFITNLIDGKELPVYGDGKNVRDWLHVEDHIRAIELVLDKGEKGKSYLVGGQKREEYSNLKIAKLLCKMFHENPREKINYVEDRLGHDRRYAVDWSTLENMDWKPKYDFDEWLKKTVEWYVDNEWWWRPLKKKSEKFYSNS